MSEIRFDRLKTLADWLMQPQEKLGHDVFWFEYLHVVADEDDPKFVRGDEYSCGTLGCAMGEVPFVWPKEFVIGERGGLFSAKDGRYFPLSHLVKDWFGLDYDSGDHLFYPDQQKPERYGGEYLGEDATKEDVAANIYDFIAQMEGPLQPGEVGGERQDV